MSAWQKTADGYEMKVRVRYANGHESDITFSWDPDQYGGAVWSSDAGSSYIANDVTDKVGATAAVLDRLARSVSRGYGGAWPVNRVWRQAIIEEFGRLATRPLTPERYPNITFRWLRHTSGNVVLATRVVPLSAKNIAKVHALTQAEWETSRKSIPDAARMDYHYALTSLIDVEAHTPAGAAVEAAVKAATAGASAKGSSVHVDAHDRRWPWLRQKTRVFVREYTRRAP